MSKPLSLTFAIITTLFLSLTAIAISHSFWYVLLFGTLSLLSTGAGFIVKAKLRRKKQSLNESN
ncbi:hypothetical protein ACFSTH_16450 [Paenibacillus yanchengensis]|uniref:Uncharacterized protein n=1 Tax=Paenibacillus yanchengensis TaxID=2035833 RepID=A0ABW4YPX8_9BACL